MSSYGLERWLGKQRLTLHQCLTGWFRHVRLPLGGLLSLPWYWARLSCVVLDPGPKQEYLYSHAPLHNDSLSIIGRPLNHLFLSVKLTHASICLRSCDGNLSQGQVNAFEKQWLSHAICCLHLQLIFLSFFVTSIFQGCSSELHFRGNNNVSFISRCFISAAVQIFSLVLSTRKYGRMEMWTEGVGIRTGKETIRAGS